MAFPFVAAAVGGAALLGGSDYNQEIKKAFNTMAECKAYLDGVIETIERIEDKPTITKSSDSVQLIITDNIRNYYTEYFWWISTED